MIDVAAGESESTPFVGKSLDVINIHFVNDKSIKYEDVNVFVVNDVIDVFFWKPSAFKIVEADPKVKVVLLFPIAVNVYFSKVWS